MVMGPFAVHLFHVADSNMDAEGVKVLGPQLAKLVNMTELDLSGAWLCG